MGRKIIIGVVVLVIVLAIAVWYVVFRPSVTPATKTASTPATSTANSAASATNAILQSATEGAIPSLGGVVNSVGSSSNPTSKTNPFESLKVNPFQ